MGAELWELYLRQLDRGSWTAGAELRGRSCGSCTC
eukprot:COSAG02_NODE_56775_length_283_cov_5.673913_1_plen_34_part_01